ncbi:MAG: hypothetical protein MUP58_02030 [Candidatus Nanohaloarchaeota archaeon QJJ-9]|nr:hypothetical protein [Candidatus Nanohaloarchaeota archaeon QJJ-9]
MDIEKSAFKHTNQEVRNIILTTLSLGFAFTLAFFGNSSIEFLFSLEFIKYFVFSIAIVGITIIAKEIGQKSIANAQESHAKYEIWAPGIILSILGSFLGFVPAAVAGTKVYTEYTERIGRWSVELKPQHMGVVALAGPLICISMAVAFLMLEPAFSSYSNLFIEAARINTYIGLFSLVPTNSLDGSKILRWQPVVWIFTGALSIILLMILNGLI